MYDRSSGNTCGGNRPCPRGQLRRDPSLVEEYEKWARTAGVVGVGERVQCGCFGGHRVVGGRMARGARRKVRAQSQEYVGSDFNSVTGRSSGNINNNINTSPQDGPRSGVLGYVGVGCVVWGVDARHVLHRGFRRTRAPLELRIGGLRPELA